MAAEVPGNIGRASDSSGTGVRATGLGSMLRGAGGGLARDKGPVNNDKAFSRALMHCEGQGSRTDDQDTSDNSMHQRALASVMVRIVTALAGIRLSRRPERVEIKEVVGGWDRRMGVVKLVSPGPVNLAGVKQEGGSVFGDTVGRADTDYVPPQVSTG